MLLEFKAKNFKSFKDEFDFSMIPAPKQKGLDYSILKTKIGLKMYKGLCAGVIYGPNAGGKTNIIAAMEALKSIVLRGNIRNSEISSPNLAASILELIPNNSIKKKEPVEFSIKFIEDNLLFNYQISLDIGKFLETDSARKILSEYLYINEKLIFSRDKNKKDALEIGDLNLIKNYMINQFEAYELEVTNLAKHNLIDDELFLMNGFKTMFSSKLINIISTWFDKKFMVIFRADSLNVVKKNDKKNTIYVEKTLSEAAKMFGINSNDLAYVSPDDDSPAKLCSIFKQKGNSATIITAEEFESYGTIRFINMFPLVINALHNGGTLVVDEFDASIHPMALMSIINIFHNDEINKKNAQLIFNTHNPIFLNSNLFRRDEIKFVERDEVTHYSTHYSLSDFGTSGKEGVRLHDDYMKAYFVNQYGAVKDIDFTPLFENLWPEGKEV